MVGYRDMWSDIRICGRIYGYVVGYRDMWWDIGICGGI